MLTGLSAGLLWGLDTVILGIALSQSGFCSTAQAIALAPFVSTFFHDFFSSLWMLLYTSATRQWPAVIQALKTKSGRFILLGALLGGPIGMSGYVSAIRLVGPAYTAIVTVIYPAVGALLARIFLKEKMKGYQYAALAVSIAGVIALGYTPGGGTGAENLLLGFGCALLCVFGWSAEAVICAYGMKDAQIDNRHALQIRQLTSALAYGLVLLPVLHGWKFAASLVPSNEVGLILLAALFGTASYLCYYRTISKIGAAKAMALNITYSAWAILFSVLLLHTLPDTKSIICALVIVGASVLSGADFKQLKST